MEVLWLCLAVLVILTLMGGIASMGPTQWTVVDKEESDRLHMGDELYEKIEEELRK